MKTLICTVIVLLGTTFCFGEIHPSQADFNNDGKVDISDLAEFASAWLWESTCETAIDVEVYAHYIRTTTTSYWYVFTPDTIIASSYMFKLDGTGYTASIYDGCGGTLLGDTSESGYFVWPLVVNHAYFIQVQKTGEPVGDFDLSVSPASE